MDGRQGAPTALYSRLRRAFCSIAFSVLFESTCYSSSNDALCTTKSFLQSLLRYWYTSSLSNLLQIKRHPYSCLPPPTWLNIDESCPRPRMAEIRIYQFRKTLDTTSSLPEPVIATFFSSISFITADDQCRNTRKRGTADK